MDFYTLITEIGKTKLANAPILGTKIKFKEFAVGDGKGAYYPITTDQICLKNEVWRGSINTIKVDEDKGNWIVIETVLPASIGGFTIREAGVFDDEGDLIAIGKYPETYKPSITEGSAKDLVIRMILEITNSENVTLKIDPTVMLATKKDIRILEQKIKNIKVPVESVNNKTGEIILKAKDIETEDGSNLEEKIKSTQDNISKKITKAQQTFNSQYEDCTKNIGDKQELKTNSKDNLVQAINEVFTFGNNVKEETVDTLLRVDKSLQVKKKDSWEDIIKNIGKISTGRKWAKGSGIHLKTDIPMQHKVDNLNFKPGTFIFVVKSQNDTNQPFEFHVAGGGVIVNGQLKTNFNSGLFRDVTLSLDGNNVIFTGRTGFVMGCEVFWYFIEGGVEL